MLKKIMGKKAEEMALRLLLGLGFQALHRNYRYGRAEIDLIVQKADLIVFVEVKAKSYTAFGHPEQTVSQAQQERIHRAASNFLQHQKTNTRIRFDIVAVLKQGNTWKATHFPDAF
jgi:putative endonuclease